MYLCGTHKCALAEHEGCVGGVHMHVNCVGDSVSVRICM